MGIKLGVNLEVKFEVGSQTGSKNSVLTFLKCMDGSVLAHLRINSSSIDFPGRSHHFFGSHSLKTAELEW